MGEYIGQEDFYHGVDSQAFDLCPTHEFLTQENTKKMDSYDEEPFGTTEAHRGARLFLAVHHLTPSFLAQLPHKTKSPKSV